MKEITITEGIITADNRTPGICMQYDSMLFYSPRRRELAQMHTHLSWKLDPLAVTMSEIITADDEPVGLHVLVKERSFITNRVRPSVSVCESQGKRKPYENRTHDNDCI